MSCTVYLSGKRSISSCILPCAFMIRRSSVSKQTLACLHMLHRTLRTVLYSISMGPLDDLDAAA